MSKARITVTLPLDVRKRLETDAAKNRRSLAAQLLFECLPTLSKTKTAKA